MVRLVVCLLTVAQFRQWVFQFHYGTIGSFGHNQEDGAEIMFQFHYGTIGRVTKEATILNTARFQFHYGTIGSYSVVYELSI